MASEFMGRVKEAVTRELWSDNEWPVEIQDTLQVAMDEDWRRVAIGVIRAGGAIVPRNQVRLMASFLRVLEDEYLQTNHMRALTGDWASHYYWNVRMEQVLAIMQQVREIIDA